VIAILDYEAGNLTSVELAVRHVGGDAVVTQDPQVALSAERVIFPGVGSAKSCMANLQRFGLDTVIRQTLDSGKPMLAICIGMQLLFDHSEEDGGVDCLGILPGNVTRFQFPEADHVKVPHMGWNEVNIGTPHPLLEGFPVGGECYFVHSYYVNPAATTPVHGQAEYAGKTFTCSVGKDNLFATQFHPEKSGEVGLGILRRFLQWNGKNTSC